MAFEGQSGPCSLLRLVLDPKGLQGGPRIRWPRANKLLVGKIVTSTGYTSIGVMSYGHGPKANQVIHGVNAEVADGEFIVIVGPSGCGKSTLLRTFNRMNDLVDGCRVDGAINLYGTNIYRKGEDVAELRRRVGMVFQHFELFPHLSVTDNLTIAQIKVLGRSADDAKKRGLKMLERVGLIAHKDKFPGQLSGGQQQRVMIAMALSCEPKLLIADEPTTALDVSIQAQIITLLKNICKSRGAAVMLITHDMGVIAETCDRVAVLYAGRVAEIGPVHDVINQPSHPYTSGLMASIPDMTMDRERLNQIDGAMPRQKRQEARCQEAQPDCRPPGCREVPRPPRGNLERARVDAEMAGGPGEQGQDQGRFRHPGLTAYAGISRAAAAMRHNPWHSFACPHHDRHPRHRPPRQGRDPGPGAALHPQVPWQDHGHQ
eukprot:gene14898-20035_t